MTKFTKAKTASFKAALDELNDLPPDLLLGRIVLFTIAETPIKHSDITAWFQEFRLDEAYLPSPNKYLDAFKKATSDTKDTYPMSNNRTAHMLCRDLNSTPDYVRRQITREVKDSGRKRLSYTDAIVATFYRPVDPQKQSGARLVITVNDQKVEPAEVKGVYAIASEIEKRYHDYYEHLDGQKVRACIRGYLKRLNAIEIKGGVYFVHASRDEELARLAELVTRIGGGCHMDMIPMVDLERERAFITRVFEREAAESLQNITKEVDELIASRKSITPAAYTKMKAAYDDVLNNATEHMENLQITQEVTAASATVALNALTKLQSAMLNE